MNRPDKTTIIQPLTLCPRCSLEMRLFGIEPNSDVRDLYTFECGTCGQLEVRGVTVGTWSLCLIHS
jgi:hypothetical protein